VGVFGDIAVFSFGAIKMLTSGHGGMVCSRKKALAKRLRSFREYEEQGPYDQRFNFQMSDLQAAVGRTQFRKFPEFLARRKKTAEYYYKMFSAEHCWPPRLRGRKPNFYRFLLKTENPELFRRRFEKAGVETRVCIRSLAPLHRRLGLAAKRFPITEWSLRNTLSLPIHPSLRERDIRHIGTIGGKLFS
jgi:perosamine synthetase